MPGRETTAIPLGPITWWKLSHHWCRSTAAWRFARQRRNFLVKYECGVVSLFQELPGMSDQQWGCCRQLGGETAAKFSGKWSSIHLSSFSQVPRKCILHALSPKMMTTKFVITTQFAGSAIIWKWNWVWKRTREWIEGRRGNREEESRKKEFTMSYYFPRSPCSKFQWQIAETSDILLKLI